MCDDVQPGRNLTKISLEFANSSIIINEWWVMDHKNGNGVRLYLNTERISERCSKFGEENKNKRKRK